MAFHIYKTIFFLVFSTKLAAQKISQESFDSLQVAKSTLYFDDVNKKYFGCGMNLDCMGLPVVFTEIYLDKKNRQLKLSGYVNPITTSMNDTVGTNIFTIFLGKPANGKLKNLRTIIEVLDSAIAKSPQTILDSKTKYFSTCFCFSPDERLYIESSELYKLKEYDIGTLLKK